MFWDIAQWSKLRSGKRGAFFAISPHEVLCVTEVCCPGTLVSLAYYFTRHFVRIALKSLQRKNQYIGPLPHSLPSLACRPGLLKWLHSVTSNYSTCISYNFIFCPICLKFSHKFLHTYCFILTLERPLTLTPLEQPSGQNDRLQKLIIFSQNIF